MTKTNFSEIDAMKEIDDALSKIDAEAQQRVISWATLKYKLKIQNNLLLPATPTTPSQDNSIHPKDIKTFIAQKRPDGNYERVAALTYYLEKFQNMTEVTNKDIVQANSDARLAKMSNATVFIKHTTHSYGYLTSLGGRKLALSARGEALVDALPDRTRVDEALANNPFKRKSSKRKNNSK